EDAADRFRALSITALAKLKHFPEARALWGARLAHIAAFVAEEERKRLGEWAPLLTEGKAEASLAHATLRARIDRIDRNAAGALEVIDYKTGRPPTARQVHSLLEPQLALEAALVRLGGLDVPPDTAIAALTYIAIGSGQVPVKWHPVSSDTEPYTADSLAARAMEEFRALMEHYRDPATGYLSRARVTSERDVSGDYDHLARTAEWQSG
ncbi:MAG: PD-(D/E)XK nuclease family protein, partial [Pseudomonadota bacterium]